MYLKKIQADLGSGVLRGVADEILQLGSWAEYTCGPSFRGQGLLTVPPISVPAAQSKPQGSFSKQLWSSPLAPA